MTDLQTTTQGRVPAKQTLEFFLRAEGKFDSLECTMNNLTTELKLMKQQQNNIGDKLEQHIIEQKEQFSDLGKKIDAFIESADGRYATKKVESVMWAIGGAVGLAVLGAIFQLIFK